MKESGLLLDADTVRDGGRAAPGGNRAAIVPATPVRQLAPQLLKQRLIAADVVAVVIGIALAFGWQSLVSVNSQLGNQRMHLSLAVLTFPVWIVSMALNKLFLARAVARPTEEFRRIINASLMSVGFMIGVAFAIQFKSLSRLWMLSVLVFVPLCLVIERTAARRIFARLRRRGVISRKILIIGTDAEAIGLLHATQRRPELGYHVVGFVGPDDIGVRGGCEVLGALEDTETVLEQTGATGAMISLASVAPDDVNLLTRRLTDAGYHVALSSGLRDIDVVRFRGQDIDGRTLIYVEQTQRGGWRAVAKRTFDISVALVALTLAAPVMLVAAVAIKRGSPGPVIFAQKRVGRDGAPFMMMKLRSMTRDAEQRKADLADRNEADGVLFKVADDPRITKVGAILRRFSIDEIPQFVNVLRGEMSVVGPRPALPEEVDQWTDDVHERLRVYPGITGMWQVSGRSDTTFEEYKRLDLYYVDNWSLAHDLRIVARTFSAVVGQRGAR
jgi:exopolysaccharide biosynthesis polyprenyl glycosylphosphotransferase